MPRQSASDRNDLQGAAGITAAELEEELDRERGGQDYDPEDDTDAEAEDDTDADAERIPPRPRPRGRGPAHQDVTADWEGFYVPPTIRAYLKSDELRVISMRRHVICLAWPAIVFAGGLLLAITLNAWAYFNGHAAPLFIHILWWSWVLAGGWASYKWLEWRQTWFVVTGFRLMLVETTRLLGRRVRMLPLDKLRDLEFSQTSLGRWQGYATFTFASIGTGDRDRALSEVDYMPEPEWLYQQINELTMPIGTGRIVKRSGS